MQLVSLQLRKMVAKGNLVKVSLSPLDSDLATEWEAAGRAARVNNQEDDRATEGKERRRAVSRRQS